MEHEVNLVARYEAQLLEGGRPKDRVIPAVVITGFLGAGKTSLVQHVLRNRGSLRIGVLINEVGAVDVDSELVNAKQRNAAVGLAAADLSGGCVCCSRADDLAAALRAIRGAALPSASASPSGAPTAIASATPAASAYHHPPRGHGSHAHEHSDAHAHGAHTAAAAVTATAPPPPPPLAAAAAAAAAPAPLDYLLVETSGAADAGPLAAALAGGGFRLDGVVAVVDAEAGVEALEVPVARAQVACADTVVLNKCDLLGAGPSSLGRLADLEDALSAMAPGVRLVRARFGEVPLTAVLDVEPVTVEAAPGAPSYDSGGGGGGGGGGGFMSHESMPAMASGAAYRLRADALTADGLAVGASRHAKRRAAPPPSTWAAAAAPHGRHEGHHHPGQAEHALHQHLHSGYFTESLTVVQHPLCLGDFSAFLLRHLVREPALLRSKGVLWFAERRGSRFTFHLSGRKRVECSQEGPWEGPPATQLVFIGTDEAAVRRLYDSFVAEVVTPAAAAEPAAAGPRCGSGADGAPTCTQAEEHPPRERPDGKVGATGAAAEAVEAVEAVVAVIRADERLQLLQPAMPPAAAAAANGAAASNGRCWDGGGGGGQAGAVLAFSARSSPLHGIASEDVNADLLRAANATGAVLVVGVRQPGHVSAVTNLQGRDRVTALLLPVAAEAQRAQAQAEALRAAAAPVLRTAYTHVHSCKCDVASAVQAMRS